MAQRITYISSIDGRAATRQFRESVTGTRQAQEQWEALTQGPGARWTLCAVWMRPDGIVSAYRVHY